MKLAIIALACLLSGCALMPKKAAPHKFGAPIGTYPNASALTGPEQMIGNQGGVTVTITPAQLATFVSGNSYTVSGLPTCNSSLAYRWAVVTDDVLATQAWGNTVTGGGTGVIPVFCNGTYWTAR
jgi:hypothetical protein